MITNGNGSVGAGAVPYPTRTKTWDADTQVLTIHESQGWDNTQLGWNTTMDYTYYPTASPDLSFEWLSLARTGASPNYPAPRFDRSTTRTLGSDPFEYMLNVYSNMSGLPPCNILVGDALGLRVTCLTGGKVALGKRELFAAIQEEGHVERRNNRAVLHRAAVGKTERQGLQDNR